MVPWATKFFLKKKLKFGVPAGFTSSVVGIKIYVLTAVIKMYKSIIKKKKEKAWPYNVISKNWIKYFRSFDF